MSIFNFKKFYDVADHLKDYSEDEEYQRSSISRYYYSVFHPVYDYYEKSFRRSLPLNNRHSNLIEELENSPFEEEQELGDLMRDLRKKRNHADYNQINLSDDDITDSKDESDEILKKLDHLKKHPLRLMKK